MAGRLLGHRRAATTNRYAHLDDATLREAAERVAGAVERKLHELQSAANTDVPVGSGGIPGGGSMRVFAAVTVAAFVAMVAWSSSAQAVDVEIHGYPFGCKTPDGETRKPKFGDVGGMYFAGLPQGRKACLETIDRMIYSCGANTTFISHDLNNQYADCLPIFEQQAKWCTRHFELQRSKCDAGGTSAPAAEATEAGAEPAVEPADATMWALKRSNIRSGPGTDHAKVGLLEVGDEVEVTGEIGSWLRIAAPGGSDAFVYAPLLADADPVMDLDPKCQGFGKAKNCWLEITGRPNCYVWVSYLPDAFENVSWSGQCSGGFARGKGTLEVRYSDGHDMNIVGALSAGKFHGQIVLTNRDGKPFGGGFYVDGEQQFNIDVDQKPEISEPTSVAAAAATGRVPAADTASTGPLHGSITFSQEADGGYAWGIAWSFDSRAGALSEATDQCREYAAPAARRPDGSRTPAARSPSATAMATASAGAPPRPRRNATHSGNAAPPTPIAGSRSRAARSRRRPAEGCALKARS